MTVLPRGARRRRPRRLRAAALVAVTVAVLISALPGTATAAGPTITPLLNCVYPHSDGSLTVVLGYRSTFPNSNTIPRGKRNHTTPSSYGTQMPTRFQSGTNNGVVAVRIAATDLSSSTAWHLDGTTLTYTGVTRSTPICSQAQLPAFANGAAIVVAVVLAGLVGAFVLRRTRRVGPRSGPSPAAGGDRA